MSPFNTLLPYEFFISIPPPHQYTINEPSHTKKEQDPKKILLEKNIAVRCPQALKPEQPTPH